jgi:hypothetical protein
VFVDLGRLGWLRGFRFLRPCRDWHEAQHENPEDVSVIAHELGGSVA